MEYISHPLTYANTENNSCVYPPNFYDCLGLCINDEDNVWTSWEDPQLDSHIVCISDMFA